jgi:hypothetical protein
VIAGSGVAIVLDVNVGTVGIVEVISLFDKLVVVSV